MPKPDEERPINAPDSSEAYERAVPEKEPGMGKTGHTHNTPVEQPDEHLPGREQSEEHRELTAHEVSDQSEGVDPRDTMAHGGRASADEAEAIGKVRRSEEEQDAQRQQKRPPGPGGA